MSMRNSTVIMLCVAAAAAGFLAGRSRARAAVRIVRATDTVVVTRPEVRESLVVRREVVRLPYANIAGDADSLTHSAADSVAVAIDMEQRVYADSAYIAYVSGYRPRLDSLRLISHTAAYLPDMPAARARRWSLTLGAGLVCTPRRVEPGAFIGVGYTLFRW